MRLPAAICGVVVLLISGAIPRTTGKLRQKRKTLTPEQQEYQREWRAYMAKRPGLQAGAKRIFDAEMARENAGACPDRVTTYDINVCLGKEVTTTDANLKSYEDRIRELIASAPEMPGAPASGPAGPSLTSAQLAAAFDQVRQTWEQYRETACTAAFHQFSGGTGGQSFEMECRLKLDRDHMRELSLVYGGDLRL
jgi:uncharacterized protein YecT (DUF1311 family)